MYTHMFENIYATRPFFDADRYFFCHWKEHSLSNVLGSCDTKTDGLLAVSSSNGRGSLSPWFKLEKSFS